jgi:hypothetical protein
LIKLEKVCWKTWFVAGRVLDFFGVFHQQNSEKHPSRTSVLYLFDKCCSGQIVYVVFFEVMAKLIIGDREFLSSPLLAFACLQPCT